MHVVIATHDGRLLFDLIGSVTFSDGDQRPLPGGARLTLLSATREGPARTLETIRLHVTAHPELDPEVAGGLLAHWLVRALSGRAAAIAIEGYPVPGMSAAHAEAVEAITRQELDMRWPSAITEPSRS